MVIQSLRHALVALAVVGAAVSLSAAPAEAAYPGANGQIVYSTLGLSTIFPDGTGSRPIGPGATAAWSPNGQQIAFSLSGNVQVEDADGSHARVIAAGGSPTWSPDGRKVAYNRNGDLFVSDLWTGAETTLLGGPDSDGSPAWSPDGTKIAFTRTPAGESDIDIWVVNPDGSGATNLRDDATSSDVTPDWSPDGTKIAFTAGGGLNSVIHVMNADGSGLQVLTSSGTRDHSPAWSPDGTRIAFASNRFGGAPGITTMNPDGSAMFRVTPLDQSSQDPNWGPAVTGYARPKAASPMRVALVPSYNFCFAPNETHGPPLAFPSCNPPAQPSLTLTVGTPDANGAAANAVAFAKLTSVAGDPGGTDEADVEVVFTATDVRCLASNAACPGGAGSAFSGSALFTLLVRITDRLDGLLSTTRQQIQLRAPVACAPTSDPEVGSTCALATSIDAVTPGAVPEGRRSIWEVSEVQMWDPGPNGTGYASCPQTCGDGDEALFLRQGLFVP